MYPYSKWKNNSDCTFYTPGDMACLLIVVKQFIWPNSNDDNDDDDDDQHQISHLVRKQKVIKAWPGRGS